MWWPRNSPALGQGKEGSSLWVLDSHSYVLLCIAPEDPCSEDTSGRGHIQDHKECVTAWGDHMRWPHDFQLCHSCSQDVLGMQSPLVRILPPFFALCRKYSAIHRAAFQKWAFSLLPFNISIVWLCVTGRGIGEEWGRKQEAPRKELTLLPRRKAVLFCPVIPGLPCQYAWSYPMRWL